MRGTYENVSRIIADLDATGVEFLEADNGGPGVRLKGAAE